GVHRLCVAGVGRLGAGGVGAHVRFQSGEQCVLVFVVHGDHSRGTSGGGGGGSGGLAVAAFGAQGVAQTAGVGLGGADRLTNGVGGQGLVRPVGGGRPCFAQQLVGAASASDGGLACTAAGCRPEFGRLGCL